MDREAVEKALADAVERASAGGWPRAEMASIAFRRWVSFARRHKTKKPTTDDRILDLAKGLQAHFEPDIPYTHFSDWLYLASALAQVFETTSERGE